MGFGEEQTLRLELLAEAEEPTLSREPIASTIRQFGHDPVRRLGHFAILLMCVAGMILVWLYSYGRGFLDGPLFTSVSQVTSLRSLFANPVQVGVVSVAALITALRVAIRRRKANLRNQLD